MFGETLKTLRRKAGLSQEELAARMNVVRQTISKWENNLSMPDVDQLVALSGMLGVPVGTLTGAPTP
ncbi:MAG: helix-turn-helix transcriptional regulator, partial [Clostridiales bacterium]|nr:helix-turn-helix transcriptional regulator [Clostridiales bacterium]